MSIEIVILKKGNGNFSLWIGEDQPFRTDSFLELMAPLKIIKKERTHQSFAPAEIIDDIHTEQGTFSIHNEYDEFAGTTLSTDKLSLIKKIRHIMLSSGQYHLRS